MDYPYVELSRMLELPQCAIHCSTEEEANILISNVKEQFPSRSSNWSIDESRWSSYKKGTCYTMFFSGSMKPTRLSYCGLNWFRDNKYEIVEFSELFNPIELEESEMPIESILFG